MEQLDVAIVGAGPFGLSTAAWLGDLRTRVYGAPMQTWRTVMPPDMLLRSAWEETSLSAPGGKGSLDEWTASTGAPRREPIPLEDFLRYADWFRDHHVADHRPENVTNVELVDGRYRVRSGDDEVLATNVVVAVGITPFPSAPAPFAPLLGSGVGFATEFREFGSLAGRRVIVVGAGQAGLESAGLAARAGAEVELLARSEVRWFADREPHHERGPLGRRLYRLAYPVVGFGPPPFNRLVIYPDLFAALPRNLRTKLTRRALRSGGSPWVRSLVEGKVTITSGVGVRAVERNGGALRLTLDDGSSRDADEVLLATGYRFDADRLAFLDGELRRRIRMDGGWPVLDRTFESTLPGLFFVGYAAEGRFGPLSRFVIGTGFAMPRLRDAVMRRRET